MMRSALLWASTNPFLSERLPEYGFVRRAVRRFMPGEEASDALREAGRLQEAGAGTILTKLGENVATVAEAGEVVDHYLGVLDQIGEAGVDAEISVKPTQLGLDLGEDVARDHLLRLVDDASERGVTVWIDMESSAYVDRTLDLFRAARERTDRVGVCLQAYLRRTEDDFEALLPLSPAIRLVKGAYMEPPTVAFPRKPEVDSAFRRLASRMLREAKMGRMGRVAVATHDARLVGEAQARAHELELPSDRWEVEMLYGIARPEQERLLRSGTDLRVLVSYGAAWFPWYMRRLAERPANVWFVVRQMAARG